MFPFSNVVNFFAYKLSGLRRGRLPFASILTGALDGLFLWHVASFRGSYFVSLGSYREGAYRGNVVKAGGEAADIFMQLTELSIKRLVMDECGSSERHWPPGPLLRSPTCLI